MLSTPTASSCQLSTQSSSGSSNNMTNSTSSSTSVVALTAINTSTPCAACKLLRRRCAHECPFAPYFSPHDPQRFASVHKIYGASNVSKMLSEVAESQRADAANSLVYEANARIRDPIYGCTGLVTMLQQQAQVLEAELSEVRSEILRYKATATGSRVDADSPIVEVRLQAGSGAQHQQQPLYATTTAPILASPASSLGDHYHKQHQYQHPHQHQHQHQYRSQYQHQQQQHLRQHQHSIDNQRILTAISCNTAATNSVIVERQSSPHSAHPLPAAVAASVAALPASADCHNTERLVPWP